mgnify:CR=1 FL=1
MKMIVFDLDGTLLTSNKTISDKSRTYLKKLKEMGYVTVIATGRMFESMKDVVQDFGFADYIITDTGATCYDSGKSEIVFANPIDVDAAKKLKQYYSDKCNYIDICTKEKIYKYTKNKRNSFESYIEVETDWNSIFEKCGDIYHITISMNANEYVIDVYKDLKEQFLDLNIIIMQDSYSNKQWIEVFKKGTSKYNAISKLANILNINNKDIIAFGDGLNDLDMLKNCGVGVALKNALPEVKEAADYVTQYDYDNDGVIEFLKKYLKVK